MIETPIPDGWRLTAEWMADDMGELNNSIRRGEGNMYGFLGELLFIDLTGAYHNNTYDWDVELADGSTVDVKTKCVTSPPKDYYDCWSPTIDCYNVTISDLGYTDGVFPA